MAKEGEAIELFGFPVQGFSFMGENLIRGTEPPAVDGHLHAYLRTNIGVLYAGGRQTGDPVANEMHKRDTVFLCIPFFPESATSEFDFRQSGMIL